MDERNEAMQEKMKVGGTSRAKGRPRMRWMESVTHGMNECG